MNGLGSPFGPFPPGGPSVSNWSDGQCKLALSGSSLLLSRFGGRWLWIGDEAREIPAAGVTLAATGLSSSTLYYIYARWVSSMVLEPSTTGYETDALTGHAVKTKDRSRRLVGAAYITGGGAFADSTTQRLVRSYFNDPGYSLSNAFSTVRTTASTSFLELNPEIRIEFLSWSGESLLVTADGYSYVSSFSTNSTVQTSIGFDGAAASEALSLSFHTSANQSSALALTTIKTSLSEGYHYATLLGLSGSGSNTAAWAGSGSPGTRTSLKGMLRR